MGQKFVKAALILRLISFSIFIIKKFNFCSRPIKARDYKKLEIPEPKTPCYSCGKKGSLYVEKFTSERRARPKDRQEARRICRSCYNEAVKAVQTASVPLSGAVDVSRCSRVTADVGKCSVCGIAKAVWIDREAGVNSASIVTEGVCGRTVLQNCVFKNSPIFQVC